MMTQESGRRGARLFSPGFVAIMVAQVFSLLGMEILQFVIPLHLLNLTGSGTLYGAVVALGNVPYLLLAPIGGVVADRTRKRAVMAACDLVLAAALLGYLALSGSTQLVPLTSAVLMVAFAAQAIYQPCVQSSVPRVMAPERLEQAVAVTNQVSMLTGIGGPVLGGLVFGFFGLAPIVVVSAACFVVALRPGGLGIKSSPALLGCTAAGLAAIAAVLAAPLPALGAYAGMLVAYLASMAFCMALSIVAMSYLQLKAPETLVGKVMALAVMLANFAAPAGQVVYGLAFDRAPAWSVALVAAVATAAVAAWLSRSIRER